MCTNNRVSNAGITAHPPEKAIEAFEFIETHDEFLSRYEVNRLWNRTKRMKRTRGWF